MRLSIYTRFLIFFICSLCLTVPIAKEVAAQDNAEINPQQFLDLIAKPSPEQIVSAKETEDRRKLIFDFVQAAFVDVLWLENSLDSSASLKPFENYLRYRHKTDDIQNWLQEFTKRTNGLPKPNGVVRWRDSVDVSIGWPKYGIDNTPHISTETTDVFSRAIVDFLPELSAIVPVHINFVSPQSPSEITPDYARIRIVPIASTGQSVGYKVNNYDPAIVSSHDWYYTINSLYVGAIPFTPHRMYQVDGFLLPGSDNSLGLAVCRILETLPEEVIRGLVSECLVRAMGLPGSVTERPHSLLGAWNAAEVSWRPEQSRSTNMPALTENDKRLLRLLYCESLKNGADKYQSIITLLSELTCHKQNY